MRSATQKRFIITSQQSQQYQGAKLRLSYGYVILVVVFLIMMATGGSLFTFGVFFKPLLSEFGWTRALASGAFSLYMVLHGLLYVVTGRLNDRFGPRAIVSGCGFFLGLGYLLMSQTSTIWHLYLFYGVIIAIGMSGGYVPLVSTVARWFIKRRGLMTGIALAGMGAGTMIIPPVANWLISNYGWRTSYAIMGFVVLVVVTSAAQFLRRASTQRRQLPHGDNDVRKKSLNLKARGLSLQEAVRTRQFWLCCVIFFGVGIFLQAIMVHIIPHAIEVGIPVYEAPNIFISIGGLSIIGRIVMGGTSDKISSRLALIISFVVATAALAWLLVAKEMWMLYLFAAVFGFAYGGFIAVQSPWVAELFGLSSHGTILGVIVFVSTIGGAVGPVAAGGIFDIRGNYDLAFSACTAMSVIGLILTALLTPTKTS